MRKWCPNFDQEGGLDTILEVPIPEEMFTSTTKNKWGHVKSWMKLNHVRSQTTKTSSERKTLIQLMIGVIGAPLFPLHVNSGDNISNFAKDDPIQESSMAKYIIHQYIAAVGGYHALRSVDSLYAMGKVKMMVSDFNSDEGLSQDMKKVNQSKVMKFKGMKRGEELGAFVLWSKRPDLWVLDLVVSGVKITTGNDGKVAWRQTPWHDSHASREPPRPLRRSIQGLDPRLTADLFSNSVYDGEKIFDGEDCFVLKLVSNPTTLEARSNSKVEIIRHTVWGYFSQRSGLLIHLEDSHNLRIKISRSESFFWETTTESTIQDYRIIDGINIAHSGKTSVSLFKYGQKIETSSRTRLEEVWSIEEFEFNIKGLTMDSFLPPGDLKKKDEDSFPAIVLNKTKSTTKARYSTKLSKTRVAAIDDVSR